MTREEFGHAYQYTVNSWINEFLREQRPRDHLNNLTRDFHAQQTLAPLCGPNGWPPSPAYLRDLLNQGRLTPDQRRIAQDVLGSPDPAYRIESMWSNANRFGAMWRNFGTYPTWDMLNAHCQGLDRALNRPLPEGVQVVRGLGDVAFLRDQSGNLLGDGGDPRSLIGTRQSEPGFMSTSLGATPPPHFDREFRMELDVPAGSPGVWMGSRSAYPDQRELLLPRGARYEIVDVIENPRGSQYNGVRYLIRAKLLPPGT
ncbi:ADP-ribosyltransferase [Nocardia cyriacigeorgica]|uniref:ADP-ribosyltransferase n=1 Tax=Nocardia cyriacigeorgica TaxID=135487 RepID=UPI002458C8E1|nr:ADP-ribosyltransferase [Nocardia cyriacigeorgica]